MSDLRFALRSLRRTPAFTLVAVFSLALGAGANTAIFSLIDSVMLKMLPVDHPGELSFVSTNAIQAGAISIKMNISTSAVHRMQLANAYVDNKVPVAVNGQSEPASVHFVSGNYFSMLGVPSIVGRTLGGSCGWRCRGGGRRIDPGAAGYKGPRVAQIYREALDRTAPLPGVRSASLMSDRLMSDHVRMCPVAVSGYTPQHGETPNTLWIIQNFVGPHFLTTAGMHLSAGRDFTDLDSTRPVAIINQSFADHFFAGSNPVGRSISCGTGQKPVEIVGLVANIKYFGVRQGAQDVAFMPLLQQSDAPDQATLLIRTNQDPARLAPQLRASLQSLKLPLADVTTMDSQVERSLSEPHLLAILSTFFGALAVLLATIGLYGVLTYSVSRRTAEIGIRMALGAQQSKILTMILSETARVIVMGIAGGLAVALTATRLLKSLLFGITPTDATSIAIAVAILSCAALAAGFLPAHRASKVNPMIALRHE